uniref:Taste receptor type 2 member 40 n=1 Tax=Pyxicephalus adspersus TaxID=30357 RepID=A0AAV3A898_PYXAD|nr:TPA: hypothetical protein GDO54_009891 [Pyxicephalus adspersus]
MANTTGGECVFPSTVQFWVSVATTGMLILFGISIQSFIVAVNVINWLKGRSVMAVDQIITSIGITRIIFQFSCPLHYLSYICFAQLGTKFLVLNLFTGIAAGFSSTWLSALLSIFFCFRISTFTKAFFVYLKSILSQRVVCLIITSVMLGFGYSLMSIVFFTMISTFTKAFFVYLKTILSQRVVCLIITSVMLGFGYPLMSIVFFTMYKDFSYSDIIHDKDKFQLIFLFNCLWNILPVLMLLASSVLLVISLSFHIRQMKNYRNTMSTVDTYHRMIIFTAVSLQICLLSIIVNLTERYGTVFIGIVWMYVLWNIFLLLQSVSLIYVSTKLRNEFLRVVLWVINCFLWNGSSELGTGEQMEITHF